ncbi:hypothetical protein BGZ73_002483, partial [Actinomortierella ambigua]
MAQRTASSGESVKCIKATVQAKDGEFSRTSKGFGDPSCYSGRTGLYMKTSPHFNVIDSWLTFPKN